MAVVVETTIGDFTVDLYTDERPQTCRNFLKLCKVKYYNWNLFHTVQNNFIAQTGDPTGTGKGGESIYGTLLGEKARYYEAEQMPKMKHDRVGLLSMVNCGDNMLGSQFFITLGKELQSLDGEHCVFGEITEGLEVILKFNEAICDGDHRPYQDIRISHTVVLEDPFEDPETLVVPTGSPEPTREALMSDRIGADEAIDDTAGMTMEEIAEVRKEKEAKARATILEIVGDIPDADMAPPENVLFVCKLNPVTNDDDLEIIFSRFGKIIGCEVIRDRQTGDSLQYAFIEFAERKSCEEAYFKMDNVLIDDRRIHVDFSQSVSKMRWRGKGKGIMYKDEKKSETRKRHEENDDRGGGKRRRNSSDQRDARYESGNNEKNYDDRQKSHKHERKKENGKYRKNYEDGYDKRRDDEERYQKPRNEQGKYGKRRDDEDKYDRRRDDEERYEKRRDIDEKYDKQRYDSDNDKYAERRKGNNQEKEGKYRSDARNRRNSRSRSRENRNNQPTERRQKRRDEKRHDYENRQDKSSRANYGDKRSRDQSEENYRKHESRYNHRNK